MPNKKYLQNTRKRILFLFLSLISLLTLLSVVTYSWFITAQNPIVHPTDYDVVSPPNLYIGNIEGNVLHWDEHLDLTELRPIQPVCGNGKVFFTPVFTAFDTEVYDDYNYSVYRRSETSFEPVEKENLASYLIETDFCLKSSQKGRLFLSPDSKVSPNLELSPESTYLRGVSTGYIAGSLRIGISQKESDGSYTLKCIWIPNPNFEYDEAKGTFKESGERESSYIFVNTTNPKSELIIDPDDYEKGYTVINDVLYVWDVQNCDCPFAMYIDEESAWFRMTIWLDGTDRECVNALSGGRVDMRFGITIS